LLNSITELIKGSRPEELPEKISQLLARLKEIEKELGQAKTQQALKDSASLLSQAELIGGVSVIAHNMPQDLSGDDLRVVALDLRSKLPNSVIALSSAGAEKVVLVVAVDETARGGGAKAGVLVKTASGILGGGGGGKDDFAQGGGVNAAAIPAALQAIKESLRKS
jgi:alanyl-tRNA synthetase